MTVTARDIEKLRAIDIYVKRRPLGVVWMSECPWSLELGPAHEVGTVLMTEEEGWQRCKAYVQSPDGMKAMMADKVQWLCANVDPTFTLIGMSGGFHMAMIGTDGEFGQTDDNVHATVEAAVDALFWMVP